MSPRPGGIDIKFEYGKPKEKEMTSVMYDSSDDPKSPNYDGDNFVSNVKFEDKVTRTPLPNSGPGSEPMGVREAFSSLLQEQEHTSNLLERLTVVLQPVLMLPNNNVDMSTPPEHYTNAMAGAVHEATMRAHADNALLMDLLERIDL